MKTPLYIFAGSHQQASIWARERMYGKADAKAIDSVTDIMGVRDFHYVKVGTWWQRPDRFEIESQIAIAGGTEAGIP